MLSYGVVMSVGVAIKTKTLTDDQRHKKIESAADGLLDWLGVSQQWRIIVAFVDSLPKSGSHRSGAVATVTEDYPYRTLTIVWLREAVDVLEEDVLQEVTLHEILHILLFGAAYRFTDPLTRTQKLTAEWMDIEEAAVDLATHFLTRLQPAGGWK